MRFKKVKLKLKFFYSTFDILYAFAYRVCSLQFAILKFKYPKMYENPQFNDYV